MDDIKMKNFTSCFKDKEFLRFFFKRLRLNNTGKYQKEFPFYSPCGPEKNFVRCDDLPVVFTHIIESDDPDDEDQLAYGHAGDLLRVDFEPEKILMLPESGRVYHPGPKKAGGVGLVKSSLAIKLSEKFIYQDKHDIDEAPKYLMWRGEKHLLTHELMNRLRGLKNSLQNTE